MLTRIQDRRAGRLGGQVGAKAGRRHRRRVRGLGLEQLEPRTMLSTFQVTTPNDQDDGSGLNGLSLREAIALSNQDPGPDTITLPGGSATLLTLDPALGELVITGSVTIVGRDDGLAPAYPRRSTIDLGGAMRALRIEGPADVTLDTITIRNGFAADGRGGAIDVPGGRVNLTLRGMTFEDNTASGQDARSRTLDERGQDGLPGQDALGGAVYKNNFGGSLTIVDSTFTGNVSRAGNGGIAIEATGGRGGFAGGGAVFVRSIDPALSPDDVGTVHIESSTFVGNETRGGVGGGVGSADGGIYRGGDGGDAAGGAIGSLFDPVEVIDSVFRENRALSGAGYSEIRTSDAARNALLVTRDAPGSNGVASGGAISKSTGSLTLTGSTFLGNVAAGGRLDLQRPFSGGIGGRGGVRGGDGGDALGGAVRLASSDDGDGPGAGHLIVSQTAFLGNVAMGAPGGVGGGNFPESIANDGTRVIPRDGVSGGDGGDGGRAIGAAIQADEAGSVLIEESIFTANGALGGRGGAGGSGHPNENGSGGAGGVGGAGGIAGGTVAIEEGVGPFTIRQSVFTDNRLAGGEGGEGGPGGFGIGNPDDSPTGGSGGRGGYAGSALGGGLFFASMGDNAQILVEQGTMAANILASGWGGDGGHGADGLFRGGHGGEGGSAGLAGGGGIEFSQTTQPSAGPPALTIRTSTLYGNLLVAGDGGNGGSGGIGNTYGGDGGRSGQGGNAQGGGLYTYGDISDAPAVISLQASTISANVLEAGAAGRGGYGGPGLLSDQNIANYVRDLADPFGGRIRSHGSTSIFLGPAYNPFDPDSGPTDTRGGLLASTVDDTAPDPEDSGVLTAALSISLGTGALTGATGGGIAMALVALAPAVETFGAPPVAAAGSVSMGTVGVLGSVGFGIAGVLVAEGALLTGLGIAYSIQTGSLEQGFDKLYDLLGKPTGERYDASVLLLGRGEDDDGDGTPIHEFGSDGGRAEFGVARGGGVFATLGGDLRLGRTIVAENRTITPAPNPDFEALLPNLQAAELAQYLDDPNFGYRESLLTRDIAPDSPGSPSDITTNFNVFRFRDDDVAVGTIIFENPLTVTSEGANFIGATGLSVFDAPLDRRGTAASPLALKSVGRLAINGGKTPTLKLRDDSPARAAGPILDGAETSQNGYSWAAGQPVDIGAWGGADNQAPVADSPVVFEVQEGGSLSFTSDQLLAGITDADGLVVTSVDLSGLRGSSEVERWGNWVETHSNVLVDNASEVVSSLHYALSPDDDFFGDETFRFVVSDGDTSRTFTGTIRVLPVNDPPVNTVPGPQVAYEDNPLAITGLSVSDDSSQVGDPIRVSLAVNHGSLSLGSTDGLTLDDGDGSDGTLTVTGTVEAIDAALDGLTYLPALDFSGDDTLTITTDDLGNTGQGAPMTDMDSVEITVRSAQWLVDSLLGRIEALIALGTLNHGQGNSLMKKLQLKGNHDDIGKVSSFLEQVGNLRDDGILSESQAETLLEEGSYLLNAIG